MMEQFGNNSSDLEDLREEYKNELIPVHATLMALNRDLDFSDILKPLLAETGPAVAHVLKLAKQIARMKIYINDMKNVRQEEKKVQTDFLRQSPAQTSGGSGCSAATPRPYAARDTRRQGPRRQGAARTFTSRRHCSKGSHTSLGGIEEIRRNGLRHIRICGSHRQK
jgi:hypothetical protein